MSATLGSLALASYMQSTGLVIGQTVGNITYLEFASGMIGEYAAATGATAGAVEATIAAGTTISTGGLIILGVGAVATVVAITAWWIAQHPTLEEPDVETTPYNNVKWGNITFGEMYGYSFDSVNKVWRYNLKKTGTPFDGVNTVRIDSNLFLKPSSNGFAYYFTDANGDIIPVTTTRLKNGLWFGKSGGQSPNRTISPQYPAFLSYFSTLSTPNLSTNSRTFSRDADNKDTFYLGEYYGITTLSTELTTTIISSLAEYTKEQLLRKTVNQKRRENAQEINISKGQELVINTGAATATNPNPNLVNIADYINEALANPDTAYDYNPANSTQPAPGPLPEPVPEADPTAPPQPDPPSNPILPPGLPDVESTGMYYCYNPSNIAARRFVEYLLSDGLDLNTIRKLFADPGDYVIDFTIVPVQPTVSSQYYNCKVGNISTGIAMKLVTNQFVSFDCGSLEIPEQYNSFLDYSPYTHIGIFLPYIGLKELDVDAVMGGTISVKYNIDVLTGACVATVSINRTANGITINTVLAEYTGSMIIHLPIRARSWDTSIADIARIGIGAVAAGPTGALMGSVNLAQGVLKPVVSGGGTVTGCHGFLGSQTPYLIINTPRAATSADYKAVTGRASGTMEKLGNISGFTVVRDVHMDGAPYTQEELQELSEILKGGVYL